MNFTDLPSLMKRRNKSDAPKIKFGRSPTTGINLTKPGIRKFGINDLGGIQVKKSVRKLGKLTKTHGPKMGIQLPKLIKPPDILSKLKARKAAKQDM